METLGTILAEMLPGSYRRIHFALQQDRQVSKKHLTKKPKMAKKFCYKLLDLEKKLEIKTEKQN